LANPKTDKKNDCLVVGGIGIELPTGLDPHRYPDSLHPLFTADSSNKPTPKILWTMERVSAPHEIGQAVTVFEGGPFKLFETENGSAIFTHPKDKSWTIKINLETKRIESYYQKETFSPITYPRDQLIFLRLFINQSKLFLHSAGIQKGNRGAVFVGVSGAGKTTLSRCFQDAGYTILSDEKTVLNLDGTLYGTPWPGELRAGINAEAGTRSLFFLQNEGKESIQEISPEKAFRHLFLCHYHPLGGKIIIEKMVQNIQEAVKQFKCFEVSFLKETPFPFLEKIFNEAH